MSLDQWASGLLWSAEQRLGGLRSGTQWRVGLMEEAGGEWEADVGLLAGQMVWPLLMIGAWA